jgi:hypothetical protein
MSTPSNGAKCAACDKTAPLPSLICLDCIEGKDELNQDEPHTRYCSSQCRDAHHEDHQSHCRKANTRKQIYRAGEMLSTAFNSFRGFTWDLNVVRVEKKKDVVYMYTEEYDPNGPLFFESPFDMDLEFNNQEAMLSYCACTDALRHFYNLSKNLLSGKLLESMPMLDNC